MGSDLSNREELILLAVGLLLSEAYGYSIASKIKEQTNRKISLASVHTILYRLEDEGLLSSTLGGSTEKRGGRSKRLYSLSGVGIETIRRLHLERSRIWDKLGRILSPGLTGSQ